MVATKTLSGTRDPSFWRADRGFLASHRPLRAYLRGARPTPASGHVSVTLPDLRELTSIHLEGLRLTLAVGPAVTPDYLLTGGAGNKSARLPHLGLVNLASFMREAFSDDQNAEQERLEKYASVARRKVPKV